MKKYHLLEFLKICANLVTHYRRFMAFPYSSRKHIEEYQLEKIKGIVKHAYNNVPFYREKYDWAGVKPADIKSLEDFEQFPTVTKDEIIKNYPASVLAKGTDTSKCIFSTSSGSTGRFMTIVHKPEATFPYILGKYRIFSMACNYSPLDRVLYIYTSPYPASSILGLWKSYFIETLNDISDTKQKVLRMRPDILNLYPSQLSELSTLFGENDIERLKLKSIIVGSEMSTQRQRDEWARKFGCTVLDEYSSEELTWIAAQCRNKKYHMFEDLNYIEILKPGSNEKAERGGAGEIVGTHFWNFSMPFIRYRQGDIGKIEKGRVECACGQNLAVLSEICGRKNDVFQLKGGKTLSSGYLLDLTYNLILRVNAPVIDFCLVQKKRDKIVLEVKTAGELTGGQKNKIVEYFTAKLDGGIHFAVKQTKTLYKTKTGKRNPIISFVK